MPRSQLPAEEPSRLASLHAYQIMDTKADARIDAITRVAARVFGVPIVLVSLVDEARQWFKAGVGPILAGSQTPRDIAFCSHALLRPTEPLVVRDATQDARFSDNPLVVDKPGLRFYAGMPLIGAEGFALGTLALLDTQPREFDTDELAILADLALAVASALDLHRSVLELREGHEHHRIMMDLNPHLPWTADAHGNLLEISSKITAYTGKPVRDLMISTVLAEVHPDDRIRVAQRSSSSAQSGEPYDVEYRLRGADGAYRWFRAYAAARKDACGTILRWYGTLEDITERKTTQSRVEYLAYHDALTGLSSRSRFHECLDEHIFRSRRTGRSFSLLHLDLDDFKAVNDTLGHQTGDAVLRYVAQAIRGCLTEADFAARVGGDEFFIIQSDLQFPQAAAQLAERIVRLLGSPITLDGQVLSLGISIGIVICPQHGNDADLLIQSADLALYRAKSDERGSYCFFDSAMDESLRTRKILKMDMRQALARDEFVLLYQPVVNLRSGQTESFEALLRWQHPQRGTISPSEFIPIAEVCGVIIPLGRWALEQACREAATWPERVGVAVNLSVAQFLQCDIVEQIVAVLEISGLPADRLTLEITESVPLLRSDSNLTILRRLRELGVRIALDDFGTGYASLAYLQRFAFDRIKIDQSFIGRLTHAFDAKTIVLGILGMSRALGIMITAEGVESAEQAAYLSAAGCDHAQGFFFSRPVTPDQIPWLLAQPRPTAAIFLQEPQGD